MTTSVTRSCFTTHQTCKTKSTVYKTKTDFFWSQTGLVLKSMTDGLRRHHCPPYARFWSQTEPYLPRDLDTQRTNPETSRADSPRAGTTHSTPTGHPKPQVEGKPSTTSQTLTFSSTFRKRVEIRIWCRHVAQRSPSRRRWVGF